jgi:hypothetical protein
MADPVSGVAHGLIQHNLDQQKLQQQNGTAGRSFESVLQQTGQGAESRTTPPESAPPPGSPRTVSGAEIERMRVDLMERINRLPPGSSNLNALLPELIDTRTRLTLFRDVMSKSQRGTPVGTDLRGRFGQIENEWYEVEAIMKSNRELSTTELLGLQARLYQVSQHVEVLSKVVDQVTGGIKTILNTNV